MKNRWINANPGNCTKSRRNPSFNSVILVKDFNIPEQSGMDKVRQKIRNLINKCCRRTKIKRIEKALEIKLYKWQKEYIAGNTSWNYGADRRTGRTLAYILRLLIDGTSPITIIHPESIADSNERGYPNSGSGYRYGCFFVTELCRINKTLNRGGIKTRPIYIEEKRFNLFTDKPLNPR